MNNSFEMCPITYYTFNCIKLTKKYYLQEVKLGFVLKLIGFIDTAIAICFSYLVEG